MKAICPENEVERLAALHRYDVMDTLPEAEFDRFTRVAATLFGAPIALITFIDSDRQFFKSAYGLDLRETSRDFSFCSHAILTADPMVVCDATADHRFSDNPLVLSAPEIRFYAGAPLETPDGFRLGALCVIDTLPRKAPGPDKIAALKDLAGLAVELMDARSRKRELSVTCGKLAARSRELEENRILSNDSEQLAELALEAGGMGYWSRHPQTGLISFSPLLEAFLGIDHDQYDGTVEGWLKHVHPDDRDMIRSQIAEAVRNSQTYTFKYRVLTPDNAERWITTAGAYKKDLAGSFAGAHGVSWDSTAVELAGRQLRIHTELLRGLNDSAPVGIFRTDLNGLVTHVNSRFAAIFGINEEQALGEGWKARVHPDDLAALQAALPLLESNPENLWEFEHRLLLPGGVRWLHARISTLYGPSGTIVERIGTVDDITQRRQTLQDLRDAKNAAEVANRTKDMFLANVSHELRTPLNGILGMTDLLLDSSLNSEQVEMAELVRDSGRVLLTVVNDLLDLSRIEAGKLPVERLHFRLRNAIQQSIALLQADARRKSLNISASYAPDLPDAFTGDALRIKQILLNFLSNAIKFTPAGEIVVTVEGETTGPVVDLCLAVTDSGPGIAPEMQSKLFQPFSQLDGSSTRRNGGVGLGLAICKRLAELLDGSVGVASAPGKGSTFWVRLPLEIETSASEVAPIAVPDASPHRGRVLVVEDNPVNQRVALGALRRLGWEADVAADGLTAIDLVQRNRYNVVFMDCQLPAMDGYLAATQIRKWETAVHRSAVPIVALTAHTMAGDRERCLHAGMNDFLAKPFGLEELRIALNRWAHGARVTK